MADDPTSTPAPQSGPDGASTAPEQSSPPAGKEPTFEGDFDAEKAARLVANLRAEVAELKAKKSAPEAKPAEEENPLAARLAALEADLKAERLTAARATVAGDTGVPAALLVKGDNAETLAEFAKELVAWADSRKATAAGPDSRRPAPRLTPGQGGEATDPFDAAAVAKAARAAR